MGLREDFRSDGADHSFLFDFEAKVAKKPDKHEPDVAAIKGVKESRFKTVVCRHWVLNLCMKDDQCEYLHELNPQRMPECKWGEKCQVPDCIFKHTKEEDRVVCAFYSIGFCRKGPTCRFRHVRKAPEELPKEVDWSNFHMNIDGFALATKEIVTGLDPDTGAVEKRIVPLNENFKVAICKHWQRSDSCPFGDRCHFAHGEHELRSRGGEILDPNADRSSSSKAGSSGTQSGGNNAPINLPKTALLQVVQVFQEDSANNPEFNEYVHFKNPMVDLGKDIVDLPDTEALSRSSQPPPAYFVVRMTSRESAAASIKHAKWSVLPGFMSKLNEAFVYNRQVFVFFAASDIQMFLGVAKMTSPVKPEYCASFVRLHEASREQSFNFGVDWLRTTSVSFARSAFLVDWEDELFVDIPVAMCFECSRLSVPVGHALMVMMYRARAENVDASSLPDLPLSVNMDGPDLALCGEVDKHIEDMIDFIREHPSYLRDSEARVSRKTQLFCTQFLSDSQADKSGESADWTTGAHGKDSGLVGPDGVPVGPNSIRVPDKVGFLLGVTTSGQLQEMLKIGTLSAPISEISRMAECVEAGTLVIVYCSEEEKVYGVFEAQEAPRETGKDRLPVEVDSRRVMDVMPVHYKQIPNTVVDPAAPETSCFLPIPPPQMQNIVNIFARSKPRRQQAFESLSNDRQMFEDLASSGNGNFPPGISVDRIPTRKSGLIGRRVILNIYFDPEFKAAHRLIGKGGGNMKRLKAGNSVRCSVKPLYDDDQKSVQDRSGQGRSAGQSEIEGPMQIVFYGPSEEDMSTVEQLALDLAYDLEVKYRGFVEHRERFRRGNVTGRFRHFGEKNSGFEGADHPGARSRGPRAPKGRAHDSGPGPMEKNFIRRDDHNHLASGTEQSASWEESSLASSSHDTRMEPGSHTGDMRGGRHGHEMQGRGEPRYSRKKGYSDDRSGVFFDDAMTERSDGDNFSNTGPSEQGRNRGGRGQNRNVHGRDRTRLRNDHRGPHNERDCTNQDRDYNDRGRPYDRRKERGRERSRHNGPSRRERSRSPGRMRR